MQKVELHRLYITWEVHIFLNLIYSQTDSHKELSTIIEKAKHRWLLRLLHDGLNIGITFDDLKSRDEKSINTLLENFQKPSKLSNKVNVPKQEYDYPQNAGKKAEIMILPLSIDDETTTSGTASIIQKSLVFNVNVQVITFERITWQESSIFQQQEKDSFSTKA